MDLAQDVVFLSAFLGGGQASFQFSHFVFAMIAAFQFTPAFDHGVFSLIANGRYSFFANHPTTEKFYGDYERGATELRQANSGRFSRLA